MTLIDVHSLDLTLLELLRSYVVVDGVLKEATLVTTK